MKMIICPIGFLCLFFFLILCGCETFNDSYRRDDNYLSRRQVAEAPRVVDQQMAQISASIAALNASNAEIIKHINDLNQRIIALQQRDAVMQNSIEAIKQDLDSTKKAWQVTNERMIEQISSEMNKALKSATPQAHGGAKPSGGPIGSGDFYVHTVEPGSTLNAIAKAYGVSAAEIRAANGMGNDLIRVGQKLYIPKK